MRIIDANMLLGFAHKSAESVSDFASVVRNLILDVSDSYRPEVHYMRGPGPKWRAKHQLWLRFDFEAVPPGDSTNRRQRMFPLPTRPTSRDSGPRLRNHVHDTGRLALNPHLRSSL
jgi:hypothetical protein